MLAGCILWPNASWVVLGIYFLPGLFQILYRWGKKWKLLPCSQLLQKSKHPLGSGNLSVFLGPRLRDHSPVLLFSSLDLRFWGSNFLKCYILIRHYSPRTVCLLKGVEVQVWCCITTCQNCCIFPVPEGQPFRKVPALLSKPEALHSIEKCPCSFQIS